MIVMKVVVTIAAINPKHGGPPRTIPALCRALAKGGSQVELITVGESGNTPEILQSDSFTVTPILTTATRYRPLSWRKSFCNALSQALHGHGDVVLYDVGMWLPSNHFAAAMAAEARVPLVVSPRGMLSARALEVSKVRKQLGWMLYQRKNLQFAKVLHAASESEADDFRAKGLCQPIAVIPNGIEAPAAQRSNRNRTVRTLLFLSRLHPIKGLPDLIRAWAQLRPPGWRVVIAGPDETNNRRELEEEIKRLGVRDDFKFVGNADDHAKQSLYAAADLFVLPSYSESFGQVIGEALVSGVPVITTQATPWRELETYRCGWWIPTGAAALAEALRSAMNRSPSDLQQMGARGRELILEKYSWDSAAEKMLAVFHWLLHGGEPPHCVRIPV